MADLPQNVQSSETKETMPKFMADLPKDVQSSETEETMPDFTEKVKNDNLELMMEISKLCDRKDRKKVENILLIGMSGAGKSALVNTIIKVLAGKYIPRARVGMGSVATKTLILTRYENCGVRFEDIEIGPHKDLVSEMLEKLPTINDMAGNGNDKDEEMLELLEVFIGGYIPPETSVEALQEVQAQYGVGVLKGSFYKEPNPAWKVDKVVFVQGCHDELPINLIECLQTVLKKTDPKTKISLYTQDIFVVITKYDMVTDSPLKGKSDKRHLSMEDFIAKENEIAEKFNIVGALAHNRIRWVSYTDDVGYDNPHIDNIALKFLKRMITPGIVETEKKQIVMDHTTKLILYIKGFIRKHKKSPAALAFFLFLILAIFMALFLTKPL